MRKFYIKDIKTDALNNNKAVITGQEAKHIMLVLRLSPGDMVELVDGRGTIARAVIDTISHNRVAFTIIESSSKNSSTRSESPVHITIAQGMLKDKKMDMLIRHLTELGISQWIPFLSSRSIPKPDSKRLDSRMERWNKIAREALKQCGRTMVPLIHNPVQFDDLLEMGAGFDKKIAFWENASTPVSHAQEQQLKKAKKIIVLIGPEGGFSADEIKSATKKGFNSYSLGPRILRAETASITAAALVQHFFGDLGKNNP